MLLDDLTIVLFPKVYDKASLDSHKLIEYVLPVRSLTLYRTLTLSP